MKSTRRTSTRIVRHRHKKRDKHLPNKNAYKVYGAMCHHATLVLVEGVCSRGGFLYTHMP